MRFRVLILKHGLRVSPPGQGRGQLQVSTGGGQAGPRFFTANLPLGCHWFAEDKTSIAAEVIAHVIEHGELSSVPSTHVKKPEEVMHTCNPSAGDVQTGRFLSSLICQPSLPCECQASERLSQKNKVAGKVPFLVPLW